MKVRAKLSQSVAAPGFVIRSGYYVGDVDAFGVLWMTVVPTNRIPGERPQERRVGLHLSKFAWMEEATAPPAAVDKRAEVNLAIKVAETKAKARAS